MELGTKNGDVRIYIAFVELHPIALPIKVWGTALVSQCVSFHTDKLSLVSVTSKQTSMDPQVMFLVKSLVVECIFFHAQHVTSTENAPTPLSRLQVSSFEEWASYTLLQPIPILLCRLSQVEWHPGDVAVNCTRYCDTKI